MMSRDFLKPLSRPHRTRRRSRKSRQRRAHRNLLMEPLEVRRVLTSIAFQGDLEHSGTGLHEGGDFEFNLVNWDNQGKLDLAAVKKTGTGTQKTELHVFSGTSYQNHSTIVMPLGQIGNNWEVEVADWNGDGWLDLITILSGGTGSGKTEVLVYDGTNHSFQSALVNFQPTALTTVSDNGWDFEVTRFNTDNTLDLVAINRNGTGGTIDVHVMDGTNLGSFLIQEANVPLPSVNSDWEFEIARQRTTSSPADLVAVKKSNTGTGTTEVHALDGANSYRSFKAQMGTALHETGSNFQFDMIDFNNDGELDLAAFKTSGTGTNSTEVHVYDGTGSKLKAGTNQLPPLNNGEVIEENLSLPAGKIILDAPNGTATIAGDIRGEDGSIIQDGTVLDFQGLMTIASLTGAVLITVEPGASSSGGTWTTKCATDNTNDDCSMDWWSVAFQAGGGIAGALLTGPTVRLFDSSITSNNVALQAGKLILNDSSSVSTNNLVVSGGAVLAGTGSVLGPVTAGTAAIIEPGQSPGILTTGNLTMNATSRLAVELNGDLPGTGYDQVHVDGTVTLNNPILNASLGYTPAIGKQFAIISNDGYEPVNGTFSGLGEGAALTIGGKRFHITYQGGTGNDVVLRRNRTPVGSNASFSVDEDTGLSASVGHSDPDGDHTVVQLVSGPSHASSFQLNSNGSFSYTGAGNYYGSDSFAYRVSDGELTSPVYTAAIALKPVADSPTIGDRSFSIDENRNNLTVVGTASASDPDLPDDTLTWSIVGGNVGAAFAINPATGQINVNNKAALDFETTPTFHLGVRVVDEANLSDDAVITIQLRDLQAGVTIQDAVTTEGDSGTSLLGFLVATSGDGVNVPFSVSYASADGTAVAGGSGIGTNDYDAVNGAAAFNGSAGQSNTINVTVNGDGAVELDEDLLVTLTAVSGTNDVVITDATGTGTIQNDDDATLEIGEPSVAEADGGTTILNFPLTLDRPVDAPVTVVYATKDGTATTSDSDYLGISATTLTVPAGTTNAQIGVTVNGDAKVELHETLQVLLSNLQPAGRDVTFIAGPYNTVFSHSGRTDPVTEDWSKVGAETDVGPIGGGVEAWYVNDTANANAFYQQVPSQAQIDQGKLYGWTLSAKVRVPNAGNATGGSPFVVYRDGTTSWQMNLGSQADGDPIVKLVDNSGGIFYPLEGAGNGFHLYELVYDPVAGNADLLVNGEEVVSNYTGLTLAQTVVAWGAGDSGTTGRGDFNLVEWSLVEPATGTIKNDDVATLTVADGSVTESDDGTPQLTFDVMLDKPVDSAVTVGYRIADAVATLADSDYSGPTSGTLNFAGTAGEVRQIVVNINGDNKIEPDETLTTVLTSVSANGRQVSTDGVQFDHTGAADPTTENWSNNIVAGGVTVGPIVGEFGFDAWRVEDSSTSASQFYSQTPTADQIADAAQQGWKLSGHLRILPDSSLDASPALVYRDGATSWQMHFASNSAGDPIVQLYENPGGTTKTLAGLGAGYHRYELVYDPVAGNTDLFVNGTEIISNYTGFSLSQTTVVWGAGGTISTGGGHFNSVQWSILEPATGTIVNDDFAPVISPQSFGADENQTAAGTVVATDDDLPNDTQTFTLTGNGPDDGLFSITTAGVLSFKAAPDFENPTDVGGADGDNVYEVEVQVEDSVGAIDAAIMTIIVNDLQTALTINDVRKDEANGPFVFDVLATGDAVGVPFDVSYQTSDDSASSSGNGIGDNDFVAHTGSTISFAGNSVSETKPISIAINNDNIVELNEYFVAQVLSATSNDVTIVDNQGKGTIVNDDAATLSVADVSVLESDSGSPQLIFDVTLDNPVDAAVRVGYRVVDATATLADGDYNGPTSGTLNFAGTAGEVQQIVVGVNGDDKVEPHETLTAVLTSVSAFGREVSNDGVQLDHVGAADPTTKGWTNNTPGGGVTVGAVFDEFGFDARLVEDLSTSANQYYSYTPAAAQIANATQQGWKLSGYLRILPDSSLDASPVIVYRDGSTSWQMHFASDSDGDPIVQLFENPGGTAKTLDGLGAGYHKYELIYDPVAGNADLYVDGAAVISDYSGFNLSQSLVVWGTGGSTATGGAHFNTVQWSVLEPATGTIVNDDFAPVANAGGPYVINEGSGLSANGSATDNDTTALTYRWDVDGDGDYDENVTGAAPALTTAQMTALGLSDGPDVRTVTLEASDGTNIGTATTSLTINNIAPDFEAGSDETLQPAVAGAFARSLSFTDPGMDSWTGTVDFGDNTGDKALSINQLTKSFDLAHNYTTEGTFTVSVTVKDDDNASHTDSFKVTVNLNTPPVANNDSFSTSEDSDITFDVLSNDTDEQNNIVAALTTALTSPSAGVLTHNGSGSFTYDPDGDFESLAANDSAQVSFAYRIKDAFDETDTATATITINGVNDVPALTVAGNVAVNEGQTAANSGTWSDIDASDVVTLSASAGSVTKNADGTWTWSFNTSDGPNESQVVTINATDNHGATASKTFNLTVNNVAPTANDASFDVVENSTNGTSVGAVSASDPGADTLTYSITGGTGAAAFAINASTGEITVTDEAQLDFETTPKFSLNVLVKDDEGATDMAQVTINLLNQASISGNVFVDVDQDGFYDANETGIDGVQIDLLDANGVVVDSVFTEDGGFYFIEDRTPGEYQVREIQPSGVDDGAEQLGTLGGQVVGNDIMQLVLARVDATDYSFAELGQELGSGDTATIGFWQNKHGQQLIAQGGTALAQWLSSNFGNIFGNALNGASGQDVANFYRNELFKQKGKKSAGPAKVDAQFMAVALATFFTNRQLAGEVAAGFGFDVTDTGIGSNIVNVGANGAAFAAADNADRTIMQLLLATNSLTDQPDDETGFAAIYDTNGDGVIDASEAALRNKANAVYTSINEAGD